MLNFLNSWKQMDWDTFEEKEKKDVMNERRQSIRTLRQIFVQNKKKRNSFGNILTSLVQKTDDQIDFKLLSQLMCAFLLPYSSSVRLSVC